MREKAIVTNTNSTGRTKGNTEKYVQISTKEKLCENKTENVTYDNIINYRTQSGNLAHNNDRLSTRLDLILKGNINTKSAENIASAVAISNTIKFFDPKESSTPLKANENNIRKINNERQ